MNYIKNQHNGDVCVLGHTDNLQVTHSLVQVLEFEILTYIKTLKMNAQLHQ